MEPGRDTYEVIGECLSQLSGVVDFLEIGAGSGRSYKDNASLIATYTGVDINFSSTKVCFPGPLPGNIELHGQSSKAFWETCHPDRKWHFIFIDAAKDYENASIDMGEAKKHLVPGGFVLVHDLGHLLPAESSPLRKAFNENFVDDPNFEAFSYDEDKEVVTMGIARHKGL